MRSWEWIGRVIAGQGADALVLDPPELREEVRRTLGRVLATPTVAAGAGTNSGVAAERGEHR